MNRKIFFVAAVIFAATIIFSAAASAKGVWRLDASDSYELPYSFRIIPNSNLSASGQPSLNNLRTIFDKLKKSAEYDATIYLVDLRQEPHGFADAYPVSWYVKKNLANYWKGNSGIERDELARLKKTVGVQTTFVPLGNYDTAHFSPVTIIPSSAQSERAAASEVGFSYIRFGVTDMMTPAPEIVDEFLNFVGTLDENDWLHFHCQAGHGRTTTFVVMYQLLQNPDASLEEICALNSKLGGSNLLDGGDREKFIRLFQRYAKEIIAQGGETSWREFFDKET